jgi:hypothetical protein
MFLRKLLQSCFFILVVFLISPGAVLNAQEESEKDIPKLNDYLEVLDYGDLRELYLLREHPEGAYPDDFSGIVLRSGLIGYINMSPKTLISHILYNADLKYEGPAKAKKYDLIFKRGRGKIPEHERRDLVERIIQELNLTLKTETVKTTKVVITATDELKNYIATPDNYIKSKIETVSGYYIYFENVTMEEIVKKLNAEVVSFGFHVVNETRVYEPLTMRLNIESLEGFILDAGKKGLMVDLKERPKKQYILIAQ